MSDVYPSFQPSEVLLLGPGPSPVDPKILQAFMRPTLGHLDPNFLSLMDQVRDMLRRCFKTKNEITFPVSGTGTAGMECCVANLVEPGDGVLSLVNGFFGNRMADMAGRVGGKVDRIDVPFGKGFTPEEVGAALKGKGVKVVTMVHAETSAGYRLDIAPIIKVVRDNGALVIVDTVTSLGGLPLEVDDWGIDAVFSGTQKCLGGPPGLAPVSFGPRALEKIDARKSKCVSWYLDVSLIKSYWGGTRAYHHTAPINNVYGLHESLRLVLEEGLEKRFKRHQEVHEQFARGAKDLGLEFHVDAAHRLPQLNAMKLPAGFDDKTGRSKMLKEHNIEVGGGLGDLAGKVWRIGLMGHGARPEVVDRLLGALKKVLGK